MNAPQTRSASWSLSVTSRSVTRSVPSRSSSTRSVPLLAVASLAVASLAGLLLGACGSDGSEIDCDAVEVLPYSQLGSAFVYCNSCHGEHLAEEGIRTDTYEDARKHATAILESIEDGSMPPATELPEDKARQITTWVQCGTPE